MIAFKIQPTCEWFMVQFVVGVKAIISYHFYLFFSLSPEQVRQKIICSAFLRALKDPFPPARQAGILAMAATQNYYSLSEVATRLLPALSVMTMDPDKGVREQVSLLTSHQFMGDKTFN